MINTEEKSTKKVIKEYTQKYKTFSLEKLKNRLMVIETIIYKNNHNLGLYMSGIMVLAIAIFSVIISNYITGNILFIFSLSIVAFILVYSLYIRRKTILLYSEKLVIEKTIELRESNLIRPHYEQTNGLIQEEQVEEYYQLANEILGIQSKGCYEKDVYSLFEDIEEKFNKSNETIEIRGNQIKLKDFKLYLKSELYMEEKVHSFDSNKEAYLLLAIGLPLVTLSIPFMNFEDSNEYIKVFMILLLVTIMIIAVSIIMKKLQVNSTEKYMKSVEKASFYKFVIDILENKN